MGVVIALVYTEAQRGKLRWAVGAVLLTGILQALLGVWQYRFWEDGPEGFRLPGGYSARTAHLSNPIPTRASV